MSQADAELQLLVERCQQELRSQGYALVPAMLSDQQLEHLRLEADTLYEVAEEERQRGSSSAAGTGSASGARWGADAQSSCIYESIPGHRCTPQLRIDYAAYRAERSSWPLSPTVWRLLFQSRLTQLVLALLGPAAVLFNDQYILKPPGAPLSAFRWHRDSDWCRSADVAYQPYISVWCALDDMTLGNGCFVVRPGSHLRGSCAANGDAAAPPSCPQHEQGLGPVAARQVDGLQQQQQQQELLAVQQEQQQQRRQQQDAMWPPGALPLEVPAGTAIITTDTVLHCSGPNRSQHMRRAWMPQFSCGPLMWSGSGGSSGCVSLAVPLVPRPGAAELD